jgi:ribonuclease Z
MTAQSPNKSPKAGEELLLQGYSRGLLASWLFVQNYNLLIDAGEGVTPSLYHKLGSINHIALTHSHFDHVGGLAGLLHLQARVAPESRVNLYLPGNDRRFERLLGILGPHARERVDVYRTDQEQSFAIGGGRILETFPVEHSPSSRGILVREVRRKLKPEFVGVEGSRLGELRRQGVEIERSYKHTLLAATGDTAPLREQDLAAMQGADLVITEATFLTKQDRLDEDIDSHNDLPNALDALRKLQPKGAILQHFSTRYTDRAIKLAVRQSDLPVPVEIMLGEFARPASRRPNHRQEEKHNFAESLEPSL